MSYTDEPANPFTQRKFVMSALVVGVVVVMGIILALGFAGGAPDSPSAATSKTPSTATSPAPSTSASIPADTTSEPGVADPAASVCGLPAGDQTVPTTPPEATWELVGTMAMPTAENIGPGVTSPEGIHSCYAHNPTGALFAAVAMMADYSALGSSVAYVEQRMVPGPARDVLIAEISTPNASTMPDGYGGEITAQIAGFNVDSATSDIVSMTLVIRYSDGTLNGRPFTVQWANGDWRAPVDGSVNPFVLRSLAGYVQWGGA